MGSGWFHVSGTRWQPEGVQRLCFRLANGVLFGPLLAGGAVAAAAGEALGPVARQKLLEGALTCVLLVGPGLGLLGMVLGVLGWWRSAARVAVQGRELVVERGGEQGRLALRGFRSGWVVGQQCRPTAGAEGAGAGAVVELESKAGNLFQAHLDSIDEARALLAATRLDARHRTLRMTLGPTDFVTAMLYLVGPSVAAIPAMGGNRWAMARGGSDLGPLIVLACCALAFLALRGAVRAFVMPARLTIGNDGVRIEQSLRSVFLPFAQVSDWSVQEDGVTFVMKDGRRVVARGRHLGLDGTRQGMIERLEEARRVHLRGRGREEARRALARGGQTVAAWRRGLAGVLQAPGYRDGGLDEEDLRDVLESPAEPAEARLGAALALGASDARLARRLRVMAATSARPRLRAALERLAAGELDDEALEEALAEEARQASEGR